MKHVIWVIMGLTGGMIASLLITHTGNWRYYLIGICIALIIGAVLDRIGSNKSV